MRPMKQLATLFLICWIPSIQADDLMSVYRLALDNDPQLQAAKEQLNSARESKSLARSQLLPTVGLGGTYDAVRSDVKTLQGTSVDETSNYRESGLGLNLTQPIYRRDRLVQLEQADSTIAQAEAEYAAAEIELMVRSTTAYFDILSAEDDVRVANAEREATGRQLEQAQQRFDVGLIAITDVHEAKAAYDAARAAEIAAENSLDNAWEALYEIIGPQPKSDLGKLGDGLLLNPPVP
ncbi:MAG: TolC family protein, partial [Candidatus Thiodiazotropha sp. 6PLUC3]